MKFLSQTSKHHFRWLLYRKVKFHNERRKKALQNEGYQFVNIEKFEKLRNFEDHVNFEWNQEKDVFKLYNKNNDISKTTTIKKVETSKNNKKRKHTTIIKYPLNKRRKLSIN